MENKFIISVMVTMLIALLGSRNFWAKEKIRNKAKFRETFLATLEKINSLVPDEYNTITDIIRADYPIQETAFTNYSNQLGFVGRYFLRSKWLAYRGEYPKHPELKEEDFRYRFCHFIPKNYTESINKRDEVLKCIKDLVS